MIDIATQPIDRNFLQSEQNNNLSHLSDKKKEQIHKLLKLVIDQAVYTKKDRPWTWCRTFLNYRTAKMHTYIGNMESVHQMMLDMVKDKNEPDISIAKLVAHLGKINDAIKWIKKYSPDRDDYIKKFYYMAVKMRLHVGDIEGAKTIAGRISNGFYCQKAHGKIIEVLMNRVDIIGSRAIMENYKYYHKDELYTAFIKGLADQDYINDAIETVGKLIYNESVNDSAVVIGKAIALRGKFKAAKKAVMDVLPHDFLCVTPYLEIAEIQVDLDDLNGMKNTINELRKKYSDWIIYNADIVVEIKALAHQGKFNDAIKKAAEELNTLSDPEQCNAYAEIIKELARQGKTERAKKLASKAAEEMSTAWKEFYFETIMELVDQGYVDAAISML